MSFHSDQSLNQWVVMLDTIYGNTANYSKSQYEILSHLTEVTGIFGKYLFKKHLPDKANEFLPKMFAWSVALLKKVKGDRADLEGLVLTKFPQVCPYCCNSPCACEANKKGIINEDLVQELYFKNALRQRRTLNDFQLMFRAIYEVSWSAFADPSRDNQVWDELSGIYVRLVEELSELAEAVRFYHLYPSNFDNEMADYLAWWFALVSKMHPVLGIELPELASDLVWKSYPGTCPECMLTICDCRPGPVREILSKPSLRDLSSIDPLTQASNVASYNVFIGDIQSEAIPFPTPSACVRLDIDNFKSINDDFSHIAGDEALKHVVNIIRQKIRTRDRLYRVGGDEFAVLCPDLSVEEAYGMMSRVASAIREKTLIALRHTGSNGEIGITLSVGIAPCSKASMIRQAFESADKAAIDSKNNGKNRITCVKL